MGFFVFELQREWVINHQSNACCCPDPIARPEWLRNSSRLYFAQENMAIVTSKNSSVVLDLLRARTMSKNLFWVGKARFRSHGSENTLLKKMYKKSQPFSRRAFWR
ncbi:hypothetical protein Y032_0008g159 [Ancylostoma ceylanicum]|uniref:Uncharacterized protein n=1 Tax=Ancylostoma ceylanicum TaxID=53326 RepID=A0A016VKC9_9BILA|nr:hypothetical protein Y032_0008g159 [Ancylostoma ceylanicum]